MDAKPTKEELVRADGRSINDVIAADLKILFCGINPGLYSAAIGHHFGRPGNRFWPALHQAGFTPKLLSPYEERKLLDFGFGLTNIVDRATAQAGELTADELQSGLKVLERKVKKYRPQRLAVLGVGAYRTISANHQAQIGEQSETIGGAKVWLLPNPSGLNAHFTLPKLTEVFRELKMTIE
jgi:TDG/mug DNA glycosylase family protein